MERIDASASGRVEVSGRWFGVRGRRFVRPTLTLRRRGGREIRALAELEHKPWAAEDGEVWMAAFSLKHGLDGAREVELSVAPDIAVALRRGRKSLAGPGDQLAADAGGRAPRFKSDPPPDAPDGGASAGTAGAAGREPSDTPPPVAGSEPSDTPPPVAGSEPSDTPPPAPEPLRRPSRPGSLELERLGSRLAAANHALEQERDRRGAIGRALEEERAASRRLRTELGQIQAELELARTARGEAVAATQDAERTARAEGATAAQELTSARDELRQAQRRHDDLTRRHEELTEAHAGAQAELRERAGALELAREALAQERAETGRLRNRLASMQEAAARPAPPVAAEAPSPSRSRPDAPSGAHSSRPDPTPSARPPRSDAPSGAHSSRPDPTSSARPSRSAPAGPIAEDTRAFTPIFDAEAGEGAPPPLNLAGRRASPPPPERQARPAPPPGYTPRPLNPSLRHRTWWLGRLLALVFLLVVIGAVWLVLHTTIIK